MYIKFFNNRAYKKNLKNCRFNIALYEMLMVFFLKFYIKLIGKINQYYFFVQCKEYIFLLTLLLVQKLNKFFKVINTVQFVK